MVVKKYLCAAPRPESWEEKAEALLKSLGGDKVKREHVARQTLDMLKERHKHEKKRTGPGRKSNAEHAIAFYEYLIGHKGLAGKQDSDDDIASSDDDDENSRSDQSSSSKTIDTKEFLDQHDDACDVCMSGGELICCLTCSLVFHKECIRPVLKSIPSNWMCPHCITQGVNNFKRHSKTWKSAARGILLMNKMKEEFLSELEQRKEKDTVEGEVNGEHKGKTSVEESSATNTTKSTKMKSLINNDNISSVNEENLNSKHPTSEDNTKAKGLKEKVKGRTIAAAGGNTSADSSVSSADAISDSKRNLALYKIADSYSKSTESLLVRGRRQRKQPSLYQPQLCADSRWKSDEKNLETDGNDNDHTDSSEDDIDRNTDSSEGEQDESNARHSKSRRVVTTHKAKDSKTQMENNVIICIGEDAVGRQKSDGSSFCNFCHDDASILICVFCGCRTCFGKHDETNLLLCDNCDNEYHIRCLGLSTVPSAQKWFCPSCTKIKATTTPKLLSTRRASFARTQASTVEVDSEADHSRRGSSNRKSRSSSTTPTTRNPVAAGKRATDSEVPEKRSRGRPSKFRVETESTPASSLSPRKRVRTPKAAANSVEIMEQQKRSRQSKSTTNTSATTPSTGRKRGRPPKNAPTNAPTVRSKSAPPPSLRKRGRPSKATSNPVVIPSKVDSTVKKKVPKPTTPSSSVTVKKLSNSAVSEDPMKPQEPVKVSRVSGRTVKRASFHDELDEGEQHLRSYKWGESQSTNTISKTAPLKSQEAQTHRTSSKSPEQSEPARKKQKIEENTTTQAKATLSETKSAKSQIKTSAIVEDKDEEMADPSPIAPVRMKPVLQPPAPRIAPVRMKPVLQPPATAIRPPISVPETPKPIEKMGLNAEEAKKIIIDVGTNKEEKNEPKDLKVDAAPSITKEEVAQKIQSPPPTTTTLPQITNKPVTTTIAAKAAVSTNAAPKASPTIPQEFPSSGSVGGTSGISNYPSTSLLDPVALEAAVKALPEPKETKGEKTGATKTPRRKPGARECMQISRRFGVNIIPEKYMTILLDYCRRGKVEHLIKMRERLDCHSRFLEYQLAGLEARVKDVGESKVVVPALPPHKRDSSTRHRGGGVTPPPFPMNKRAPALGGSSSISTKVPVAAQSLGKNNKSPLVASQQASSGTTSSKIRTTENTVKKLPVKPTTVPKPATAPKHPTSSITTTAANHFRSKTGVACPAGKQNKD